MIFKLLNSTKKHCLYDVQHLKFTDHPKINQGPHLGNHVKKARWSCGRTKNIVTFPVGISRCICHFTEHFGMAICAWNWFRRKWAVELRPLEKKTSRFSSCRRRKTKATQRTNENTWKYRTILRWENVFLPNVYQRQQFICIRKTRQIFHLKTLQQKTWPTWQRRQGDCDTTSNVSIENELVCVDASCIFTQSSMVPVGAGRWGRAGEIDGMQTIEFWGKIPMYLQSVQSLSVSTWTRWLQSVMLSAPESNVASWKRS